MQRADGVTRARLASGLPADAAAAYHQYAVGAVGEVHGRHLEPVTSYHYQKSYSVNRCVFI